MSTVFVSGGTRGIGRAIAERFHREGWQVGICARSREDLDAAARSLPGLHVFQADLAVREQTEALASAVSEALGALDVLVHNAGLFTPDDLSGDLATFDRLMEVNLASAVVLSHRLVPAMRARRRGTVVHMCSVAGLKGYPGGLSYCMSKHAMLGLARSMREELKADGVRVVTVLPGATATDSWAGADIPPDRMMPAEDVAEAVWVACAASPRTVFEDIVLRPQLGDV